ncbi:MAG: hypothetical protein A2Y10_02745 [Planctomycetes bacterium GWF2_41_51]|nr:MAG: hypothetical protein A2Y10_02745 [Planctomycetes bacterium GWF2_41_51]HBG27468.1 hypothetical protein [Phycisphaerales bacterium]
MSSIEVYIICEGPTEQTFVRDILKRQMSYNNIFLYPILIGKPGHQGGNVKFDRAKEDIGRFLKQRPDTYVSTMLDYFRLDPNWPGNRKSRLTAIKKAEKVETATVAEIERLFPKLNVKKRFIPYIEMHEFEALLFSDASILADKISVPKNEIDKILNECKEPEEINDGAETAPSKRLIALCDSYRKVAMGKTISEAIGIKTIREKCSHFNEWLTKLEQLETL